MNEFGRLGGSNLINVKIDDFDISSLVLTTITEDLIPIKETEHYLNAGETLWIDFNALEG